MSIKDHVVNGYTRISNWVSKNPAYTLAAIGFLVMTSLFVPGAILLPAIYAAAIAASGYMYILVGVPALMAGLKGERGERLKNSLGIQSRPLFNIGVGFIYGTVAIGLFLTSIFIPPIAIAVTGLSFAIVAAAVFAGFAKCIKSCLKLATGIDVGQNANRQSSSLTSSPAVMHDRLNIRSAAGLAEIKEENSQVAEQKNDSDPTKAPKNDTVLNSADSVVVLISSARPGNRGSSEG